MLHERVNINSIKRIIYVAQNEYTDNTITFTHKYGYNELIYHFSGNSTVKFNNKILETKKDTLRFLPKGSVSEYTVNRIEKGDCIDIIFDTDAELFDEAFTMSFSDNKRISQLFQKAFSIWAVKENFYYFKSMSIIYEIVSIITQMQYSTTSMYKKIEPAINYISANFLCKKIAIPYLASICGISESYLKKLFIKKYGLSPKKYIINLKMNYALDLLSSQMMSVTNTSDLLGYDNIYHFSKEFKKYFGISPTNYVKKCKSSK